MMRAGRWPWTAGRLVLAGFCWLTATYAFIVASAFANLEFIKPRLIPWVGAFSDWHSAIAWVWLAGVGMTLWGDPSTALRAGGRERAALPRTLSAALVLALAAAAVAVNSVRPVLPALTDGVASAVIGAIALLPLLGLSLVDHLASASWLGRQVLDEAALRQAEDRAGVSALVAAVFVTILYASFAAASLAGAFEPDLTTAGLAAGVAWSFIDHLLMGAMLFLGSAIIVRTTRRHFALQYGVLLLAATVLLSLVIGRVVCRAIGLEGASAAIAAGASAASIVATWSGLRLRRVVEEGRPLESALDVLFGSARPDASAMKWLPLLAVAVAAYAGRAVATRVDWDAVLLKCGVVVIWVTAFASIHRLVRVRAAVPGWVTALVCLVPLAGHAAAPAGGPLRHVLDRYAVYNTSFRVADDALQERRTASSFDRFLQANTGFTDQRVAPIEIDFVPRLEPRPPVRRPWIFVFFVDSLRPDYLGAYNPAVHFTPRFDQFAGESVVFTNAFTRYGGTGLSVPAIWAGSALLHKQYVEPFHPMNALEKLLDADGYHRFLNYDAVVRRLLSPRETSVEVGAEGNSGEDSFCLTLDELGHRLSSVDPATPVFAYSLPQDVHMTKLTGRASPTSREYGSSLYAPYASGVAQIDGCFGRFVDGLKARGEYERSLIVLASDHGEMLGEDRRFGHSYHLFPQVVRIPLIVHLPEWLADTAPVDRDAVRLTTDITPTIYAALGYRPVQSTPMMGRPFIREDDETLAARRREDDVLAASYGAVYAVAGHNGRRLYIADAVNETDYEYERDGAGGWMQADVSPDLRAGGQLAIRQYIDRIARMYGVGARTP